MYSCCGGFCVWGGIAEVGRWVLGSLLGVEVVFGPVLQDRLMHALGAIAEGRHPQALSSWATQRKYVSLRAPIRARAAGFEKGETLR